LDDRTIMRARHGKIATAAGHATRIMKMHACRRDVSRERRVRAIELNPA